MTLNELESVLNRVYRDEIRPRPLHLLAAFARTRSGTPIAEAARGIRTTAANLERLVKAENPVAHLLGGMPENYEQKSAKVRATIGQLIIGHLAEHVFEDNYRKTVGDSDLILIDDRSGGGDTDYVVRNGKGRQVFRLNIKFHGSQFRKAKDLVGLDPEDCFALATYKIYGALQKQEREHLPYIFVVVGVPNLTGAVVGAAVPSDVIRDLAAELRQKRTRRAGGLLSCGRVVAGRTRHQSADLHPLEDIRRE